ncbi:MAG: hypothetical protein CMM58_10690 [Rhodospirillaceae bacterium]|nr:hypothetical protein [Rhodospirillaceae bacterium]
MNYKGGTTNKGMQMRAFAVLMFGIFCLPGCADTIRANIDRLLVEDKEPKQLATETLYCYRTIGKVNCYAQPLPGQEANRLVGHEGISPRSTAATGPLRP